MDSCERQECAQGCGEHGECSDSKCECDVGWYGACCRDSGEGRWGGFWPFYRILFSVVFYAVAVVALRQLLRGMMLRRSLGCRRILLRLFRSPRNLSVFLIMCAAFLRGLWLSIDPLSFQEVMSRLSDRMLYNIVFPLMYCVYCSVLLVWSGLYQSVKNRKELWSKVYRNFIVVMMCVAMALGLAFSACQGLRIASGSFSSVAYITICAAVAFIFFGLLFFGLLLNKYIKSVEDDDEASSSFPSKGATLRRPAESESVELVANSSEESPSFPPLVLLPSKSIALTLYRAEVLPADCSQSQDSSEVWTLTSQNSALREQQGSWSEWNSRIEPVEVIQKREKTAPRRAIGAEDYVVVLTRQDKVILRRIILLSLLSAVIGLGVVGLTVLLAINESMQRVFTTLGLMFLACGMEFCAYLLVLFIFTTQIKVKSKENLHFISEIATKIAKNPGKVTIPPGFVALSKRLNVYACAAPEL